MGFDQVEIMKKNWILLILAAVALGAFGCTPAADENAANEGDTAPVATDNGNDAAAGGTDAAEGETTLAVYKNDEGVVTCPVMGAEVKNMDDAEYADHEGMRYYFCCAGCPESFANDPAMYAVESVDEDASVEEPSS
jgi:xanthine dehydrogenase accessory factor